jgi:hypothetical protein
MVDARRCDRTGANLKLEAPSAARVDPTEWGLASLNPKDTVSGNLHLVSWDLVGTWKAAGEEVVESTESTRKEVCEANKKERGQVTLQHTHGHTKMKSSEISTSSNKTITHLGFWMSSNVSPS